MHRALMHPYHVCAVDFQIVDGTDATVNDAAAESMRCRYFFRRRGMGQGNRFDMLRRPGGGYDAPDVQLVIRCSFGPLAYLPNSR
jgi:hypothetical protein